MATFKDFIKKAVKYTTPYVFAGDVAKDRVQSYGKTWGKAPSVNAIPIDPNAGVITVDTSGQRNEGTSGAYSGAYSGGSGYGGTGGTSTNALAGLQQTVRDKFSNLQNVFNSLYADIDNTIKDKVGQLNTGYDQQVTDATNSYEKGVGQTGQIFGARNLGDSSYLSAAQDGISKDYQSEIGDLTSQRQSQLEELGRYGATQKAGFDATRNSLQSAYDNMGGMDENALNPFAGTLDSTAANIGSQRANLGTQGDFINKLNAVTPAQQQFSNALATKLKNLTTSSAPMYAKKQIAQGLIKTATLNDPAAQDYWQNYFAQLMGPEA